MGFRRRLILSNIKNVDGWFLLFLRQVQKMKKGKSFKLFFDMSYHLHFFVIYNKWHVKKAGFKVFTSWWFKFNLVQPVQEVHKLHTTRVISRKEICHFAFSRHYSHRKICLLKLLCENLKQYWHEFINLAFIVSNVKSSNFD